MNGIFANACTRGQKVHETLYGARLSIFGIELGCCCSGFRKDFQLVEGGKSVRNFIESLTFLKPELDLATNYDATKLPSKEVFISVLLPDAPGFIDLKLGAGEILSDGLTYRFMAYDRNYGG